MSLPRPIARILCAAPLALALAACDDTANSDGAVSGEPVEAVAAPDGTSWLETTNVSAFDGYVVGNPDAPIKLVEYASLTCGACAAFDMNGVPELKSQYVADGRVSYEIRNQIHGPDDLVLARLVRCGQPESFHPLAGQVWGNLQAVLGPVYENQAAVQQALSLPEEDRFVAFAEQAGFLDFFASRGISRNQARACLADSESLRTIAENSRTQSEELGVQATPTFFINGENVGNHTWATLEPLLQEAGAR